jgi:hypothetical protein
MRVSSLFVGWPLALGACACASGSGEHLASVAVQQPVESACSGSVRRLSELGLVARSEFSGDAQAKVTVTNVGARQRRISPRRVALCHGPCGAGYATCRDQRQFQPPERARYGVSLRTDESIELLIDASAAASLHACTKAGLIVLLEVDGTTACTDAGTWILLGEPDQG